jgi:hypothetical protein
MGKQVKLFNGKMVVVHPVPPFVLSVVEAQYPMPEPPNVAQDEDETAWRAWHAESRRVEAARDTARNEAALLVALRDVELPEDWTFPLALTMAGIEARDGERGRRLDYIQYELIQTPHDLAEIQAQMFIGCVLEEEVQAVGDTFRDSVRGETAPGDSARR